MTTPSRLPLAVRAVLTRTGLQQTAPEQPASLACSSFPDVVRLELRLQRTSRGVVLRVPVRGPRGAGGLLVGALPYSRRQHLEETMAELDVEVDRAAPLDLGGGRDDRLERLVVDGAPVAYRTTLQVEERVVTSERAYVVAGSRLLALGTRTEGPVPFVPLEALAGVAPAALGRRTA